MLTEINHVNTGPRMDGGPFPFKPGNEVITVEYYDDSGSYYIEITDKANPEFRLKLIITENDFEIAKSNPKRGK